MENQGKTAIILGATGLVGRILLNILLGDGRYTKIIVFSRRKLKGEHPKLEVHVGDLFEMKNFNEHFQGNEVYCCIGSTQAKTPDKEIYRKIDYGIPVATGQLCKTHGVKTYIVVSALGADSKSKLFYSRMKGEMEEAVLALGIQKTHIVQPALISGKREQKRLGELFLKKIMGVLGFLMVGPLKKYRMIAPQQIAKAMIWLANNDHDQERVPSDTLKELVANGTS